MEGDRADFTIWDYVPPTAINAHNFLGHYVYGILECRTHSVAMAGRFLVRDGELTMPDLQPRLAYIAEQGKRLAECFGAKQA